MAAMKRGFRWLMIVGMACAAARAVAEDVRFHSTRRAPPLRSHLRRAPRVNSRVLSQGRSLQTLPFLPYVIVTTPRSGSTLLCSLLDAHPDVVCHGEVFLPHDRPPLYVTKAHWTNWTAQAAGLVQVYAGALLPTPRTSPDGTGTLAPDTPPPGAEGTGHDPFVRPRVLGFKHMHYMVHGTIQPAFFQWLADHHVAVIHLVRRNKVAQFLSRQVALAHKRYHYAAAAAGAAADQRADTGTGTADHVAAAAGVLAGTIPQAVRAPVTVRWHELASYINATERMSASFRMGVQGAHPPLPYLEISYEAMARPDQRASLLRAVYAFVGVRDVDYVPPSLDAGLQRINHVTCAKRIANWDKVERGLARFFPHLLQLCDTVG
jgi:hypothetical protein